MHAVYTSKQIVCEKQKNAWNLVQTSEQLQ